MNNSPKAISTAKEMICNIRMSARKALLCLEYPNTKLQRTMVAL